nr:hypothetical protein [Tanacetum cinerariifolium]
MTNGETVKDMTTKFDKLVKFEGQDFRRWQKKMHFLLTTLKVVYVLSTPSPERHEDETLETTRKRMKWKNDDYICRGHILNGYESIHACVNDCFLFRGDANKDVHFCPVCNTSRWKDNNTPGKKVPKKVLRYFSIIPRLQRLYKSSHTAKEMTWHATGKCTEPGKMQHPVDGKVWKDFDTKYLDFAAEPRNIRLGLAADASIRSATLLEYSRAVGCLMYAMISTRPDIAFAIGKLSRYTSNLGAQHWQALARVFQYLKGTMNYGLT